MSGPRLPMITRHSIRRGARQLGISEEQFERQVREVATVLGFDLDTTQEEWSTEPFILVCSDKPGVDDDVPDYCHLCQRVVIFHDPTVPAHAKLACPVCWSKAMRDGAGKN